MNEECGIIEWVNNTIAFRHALMKIYDGQGTEICTNNELKKISGMENKFDAFAKHLLPRFSYLLLWY